MWLEWLSHTLSAAGRLAPAEGGRPSRADGTLAVDRHPLAGRTAGAEPAPLVSRPIVLEPVEPPRS